MPITTPAWKIEKIDVYNAPVGFAPNPADKFHSMGNEAYYSYDGSWKNGKMEGNGVYVFNDSLKYEGTFKGGRPDGFGISGYEEEGVVSYEGEWSKGRFHGEGVVQGFHGGVYKGSLLLGRRSGKGVINYGVGLVYKGEFRDGKPHGRGVMTSELSGYKFEGSFKNGMIKGSGVLITPPPLSKRIVRMWEKPSKKIIIPEDAEFMTKKDILHAEEESMREVLYVG